MSVTLFWLSNFSSSQEALTALNQTNRPFHRASEVRFAVTQPKFVTMTTMHQSHNRDIQLPFYRGASQSLLSTVACPYWRQCFNTTTVDTALWQNSWRWVYVERASYPRLTDVQFVCVQTSTDLSYVWNKIAINFSLQNNSGGEWPASQCCEPDSRSVHARCDGQSSTRSFFLENCSFPRLGNTPQIQYSPPSLQLLIAEERAGEGSLGTLQQNAMLSEIRWHQ